MTQSPQAKTTKAQADPAKLAKPAKPDTSERAKQITMGQPKPSA